MRLEKKFLKKMNEIEKFLLKMKKKEEGIIRRILYGRRIRKTGKVEINREMVSKRRERSYEECCEVEMTRVQREVFYFIDEFWKRYGMGPTMREITKFRKSRSLGSTHEIVERLVKLGILKKMAGMERSVRPVYINFRTLDNQEEYDH
jgi:sulfur relay (sulfurtransferase) DsrC/TusE family protein